MPLLVSFQSAHGECFQRFPILRKVFQLRLHSVRLLVCAYYRHKGCEFLSLIFFPCFSRSSLPFPLKSPAATEYGRLPVP